jgi:ribosome-associated protein
MTIDARPLELARAAAVAADAKGGHDVVVLDVSEILSIADAFVVVSAGNTRLVAAVAEEVEEQVRAQLGISPASVEGLDARRWVLLDYSDVIVHVFLDEERDYYRLERLYGDAPRVEWGGASTGGSVGGGVGPDATMPPTGP